MGRAEAGTDQMGWLGLQGRVCAVTGVAGGLGRAIALGFAAAGAKLLLLDRDTADMEALARAVAEAGGEVLARPCNVASSEAVAAAAAIAEERFGGCDILVNNAALLRPGPLATLSLAEWNALISVNLTGYFLCAQAFSAGMRARGRGSIVHIASIAGRHPQGSSGAYSVTKAGVLMLSQQIATEWGRDGIRSNVVSPGLVMTPMSKPFYDAPGVLEQRSAAVPAGRIGQPEDVRDAVLFLASERAAYVTGEEITVDGGFTHGIMNLIPRPGYG
ncbi:SDR family NAD(P)-dependent oxidoreductase [Roseomonas chloroacetimidivorans]|uniref:SDR family NAD(P)-dependent oxidoreductase n=1 Tax=Roseomonas chloroacetimidivorans TaxID=1766656 RepID=UPI003C7863E0